MPDVLRQRVLLITGASSGIGAATAVQAGGAGMRVALAARRLEQLEQVAQEVEAAGGEALCVPTDVADREQIQQMVDRTVERFGRIDALFANAGYGFMHRGDQNHENETIERAMWEVNYWGTKRSIQAVVPHMRAQGAGHILICSSVVAASGLPYYSGYAATKSAQVGLFTSMQLELEPEGIVMTCVYPGSTATEFHAKVAERCGRDAASEAAPRFMVQTADRVASRVLRCLRRPAPAVWPHPLLHFLSGVWAWFPRSRSVSMRRVAQQGRIALEQRDA